MIRLSRLKRKTKYSLAILMTMSIVATSLSACSGEDAVSSLPISTGSSSSGSKASKQQDLPISERTKGSRDNTPVCLVPKAPGETVYENEYAHLDASNIDEGYVVMSYTGSSEKVKLQITGPNEITYTYNLTTGTPTEEVFPLQSGNGDYMINVFENIEGTQYSQAFSQLITVNLNDEFLPFLYPNQYVDFTSSNAAVSKGSDLCYICNSDLEAVSEIYNYIIANVEYDHEEAETVQSGYIPDVDEVLSTKKGICLDYAALMTTMLRSQRIPTRMEIGYAGTAYHAWLSTYIEDIGWVNGMIEFDGTDWSDGSHFCIKHQG